MRYTFVSYKGGVGRTMLLVNTAKALILQGLNVLLIDLDFEGSGVPIFSSLEKPDPMFQPEYLYPVGSKASMVDIFAEEESGLPHNDKGITLNGILSVLDDAARDVSELDQETMQDFWSRFRKDPPIYESRTPNQHPLEGRLFILPSGGSFKYVEPVWTRPGEVEFTPWVYHPASAALSEFRSILISSGLDQDEYFFYERLYDEAISCCRRWLDETGQPNAPLHYVLIDTRPGLTPRTLVASTPTQGIILMASGSRGNLAGINDWLEQLVVPLGQETFPPISALMIGPLLDQVFTGKAGVGALSSATDTLANHIVQSGWKAESLERYQEEGKITPPPMTASGNQFERYVHLQHSIVNNSDRYGAGIRRERTSAHPTTTLDIVARHLWGSFVDLRSQNNVALRDVEAFRNTFVPYFFMSDLLIFDRIYDFLGYDGSDDIRGTTGFSETMNLRTVILLAGHLRDLALESASAGSDPDYQAWLNWYTSHDSSLGGGVKWSVKWETESWRYCWFYALWWERKGDLLGAFSQDSSKADADRRQAYQDSRQAYEEAITRLDTAIEKQKQFTEFHNPEWPGDWQLVIRRARLNRNLGNRSKSFVDYDAALTWLEADPIRTQEALNPIVAEVSRELAELYEQDRDYDRAWRYYQRAMDRGFRSPDQLASQLRKFLSRSGLTHVQREQWYEETLAYITRSRATERSGRGALQYADAQIRRDRYWFWVETNKTGQANEALLDDVMHSLDQALNEHPVRRADINGLLGEVSLEYAYLRRDDLNKKNAYVWDALSYLISAASLQPNVIGHHLFLVIARCLDVDIDRVTIAYRKIKMRDAFYSFEQAVALYLDGESPDNYFTTEEVAKIEGFLLVHTRILTHLFSPTQHALVKRWVEGFFAVGYDFIKKEAEFARMLGTERMPQHVIDSLRIREDLDPAVREIFESAQPKVEEK